MANLPEPTSLPFEVKAIASFAARSPNEMSIEAGKIYKVIQTDGKGQWWNTQGPNGNYGWFPANYVEVLHSPAAAPPPSMMAQPQASQPAAVQYNMQASAQTSANNNANYAANNNNYNSANNNNAASASSSAASNVITYDKISGSPPAPLKTLKDKDTSPITVIVHVIGARNLKIDTNLKCEIYLFHIINDKGKEGRLIHKSTTIKKSKTPDWNERYEVSVKDPEIENIRVVLSGNKKKIGEVILPLRATTRPAFTSPNYDYRYYKLNNGDGDINIWHQYTDSRQASGPSNFQHKAHIGFNSASGTIDFGELASLPDEFRKLAMESQTTPSHNEVHSPINSPVHSPTPVHHGGGGGGGPPPPPPPPGHGGGGGPVARPPQPPAAYNNPATQPYNTPAAYNTPTPTPQYGGGGPAPITNPTPTPAATQNAEPPNPALMGMAAILRGSRGPPMPGMAVNNNTSDPPSSYNRGPAVTPMPPVANRGPPMPPAANRGGEVISPPNSARGPPMPPAANRGPPMPPAANRGGGPPPPPASSGGGPPPPANRGGGPPPPRGGGGGPPPPPPPPAANRGGGPPPPPPASRGAPAARGGGGGMSLADQLASRGNHLKHVDTKESDPLASPGGGGGGRGGGPPPPRTGGMGGGGGGNLFAELNSRMGGRRPM